MRQREWSSGPQGSDLNRKNLDFEDRTEGFSAAACRCHSDKAGFGVSGQVALWMADEEGPDETRGRR